MRKATFTPLTPKMLCQMGVIEPLAGKFAVPLSQTMGQYDIMGPAEQAHFLGQVLTESGRLRYTEEIWGPTEAQERYDIRKEDLGNTPERDGDGKKYRGRGLIQVTGRRNYRHFQGHLRNQHGIRLNLIEDPSPIADAPYNCMCAGWFWASHGLSEIAEAGVGISTTRSVTEVINGGHNHLKRRHNFTESAYEAILKSNSLPNAEKVPVFSAETVDLGIQIPHEPFDPPPNGI